MTDAQTGGEKKDLSSEDILTPVLPYNSMVSSLELGPQRRCRKVWRFSMCYSALVRTNLKYFEDKFGANIKKNKLDDLVKLAEEDPKHYHQVSRRIFPDTGFAPVAFMDNGVLVVEPMRYGVFLPESIHAWWKTKGKGKPTNYNARRDNLHSKYWDTAFQRNHGFAIIDGFYENVAVRDLVQAKVVTLAEINAEFERRARARQERYRFSKKKYTPTKTEQKPTLDRTIEIYFEPGSDAELIVPVIINTETDLNKYPMKGFAFVTDAPLPEVAAAGHDRSPVFLNDKDIFDWLQIESKTAKDFDEILARGRHVVFHHSLEKAA